MAFANIDRSPYGIFDDPDGIFDDPISEWETIPYDSEGRRV